MGTSLDPENPAPENGWSEVVVGNVYFTRPWEKTTCQ